MYAVLRTGGKQYRVAAGDTIKVEKLEGNPGDALQLADVLMLADGESVLVGHPLVEGALIKAEILDQERARKVLIFKYRRRRRYRRKTGHRQPFTSLLVVDIVKPTATA